MPEVPTPLTMPASFRRTEFAQERLAAPASGLSGKFIFTVWRTIGSPSLPFLAMAGYTPAESVADWPEAPFYDTANLDAYIFTGLESSPVDSALTLWLRDGRIVGMAWGSLT